MSPFLGPESLLVHLKTVKSRQPKFITNISSLDLNLTRSFTMSVTNSPKTTTPDRVSQRRDEIILYLGENFVV